METVGRCCVGFFMFYFVLFISMQAGVVFIISSSNKDHNIL